VTSAAPRRILRSREGHHRRLERAEPLLRGAHVLSVLGTEHRRRPDEREAPRDDEARSRDDVTGEGRAAEGFVETRERELDQLGLGGEDLLRSEGGVLAREPRLRESVFVALDLDDVQPRLEVAEVVGDQRREVARLVLVGLDAVAKRVQLQRAVIEIARGLLELLTRRRELGLELAEPLAERELLRGHLRAELGELAQARLQALLGGSRRILELRGLLGPSRRRPILRRGARGRRFGNGRFLRTQRGEQQQEQQAAEGEVLDHDRISRCGSRPQSMRIGSRTKSATCSDFRIATMREISPASALAGRHVQPFSLEEPIPPSLPSPLT
jgi:hypothetical protein